MEPAQFSIIIPTYNSEQTIRACLDSIIDQHYRNYEVLIIDGLSSDNSISIVKQYAGEHACIKWISEKDSGIYDAMNKGIRMSKGDWIYFLGSDDLFFSEKVLYEVAQQIENVDVIYGDVFSTRFNGRYDGEFDIHKIKHKNICHQAIFFKKDLFDRTGLFDISFKAHADWDHNFKWFLSDRFKKKYIDAIIAHYADGGFSSVTKELRFQYVKNWKYFNLIKAQLSLLTKVKILCYEIVKAAKERRFADFTNIILQTPKFLRT